MGTSPKLMSHMPINHTRCQGLAAGFLDPNGPHAPPLSTLAAQRTLHCVPALVQGHLP